MLMMVSHLLAPSRDKGKGVRVGVCVSAGVCLVVCASLCVYEFGSDCDSEVSVFPLDSNRRMNGKI